MIPFWEESIKPEVASGKRVLIAAHGNSLRALIKHLDGISDEDIAGLNIPTAQPLVYEFDDDMKPIRHYYLGNQEEIAKAIARRGLPRARRSTNPPIRISRSD